MLCLTSEFFLGKALHHTRLGMPCWTAYILCFICSATSSRCLWRKGTRLLKKVRLRDVGMRCSLHPMGGTAYLSLESPDEPFLHGIKFTAMPPTKRFRDMEQLSGGEKVRQALSAFFRKQLPCYIEPLLCV